MLSVTVPGAVDAWGEAALRFGVVGALVVMVLTIISDVLLRETTTVGDPLGRSGSWLAGADFTFATSRFRGDKNFLVGVEVSSWKTVYVGQLPGDSVRCEFVAKYGF